MALLASVVALTAGCEMGWEIDGHVDTTAVADPARPLYVLLFFNWTAGTPAVDSQGIPLMTPDNFMEVLASQPELPKTPLSYSYTALGCTTVSYIVVAWSPASSAGLPITAVPVNNGEEVSSSSFTPQPGDLVVASTPIVPDCGYTTSNRIDLALGK